LHRILYAIYLQRNFNRKMLNRRIFGPVGLSLLALSSLLSGGQSLLAQAGESAAVQSQTPAKAQAFQVEGSVLSGTIPLPGATITLIAQNPKLRITTTTNLAGYWRIPLPAAANCTIWAQLAGFGNQHLVAEVTATQPSQTLKFSLQLASRIAVEKAAQGMGGAMPSASSAEGERQVAAEGATGAALPSVATNSEFASDAVSVTGTGSTSFGGGPMDGDLMRGGGPGGAGGPGGGLFGGPMMMGGGGPGGFGAGRGSFRGFNPAQPHGSVFWMGSNAALDALPYALRGQTQQNPASGSNRFGLTLMGEPYLPKLTKPSGKDTVFFTYSGQRSTTPEDQYATLPTMAEREGNVASLGKITPVSQATALLCPTTASNCTAYIPLPNLTTTTSSGYNYHWLTTSESNSTQLGLRYMRSLGKNASMPGARGMRRTQQQGLRQSVNANYNRATSDSTSVGLSPIFGGTSSSEQNSLQFGYSLGYRRLMSNLTLGWNRSTSNTKNHFTGTDENVAANLGISVPNSNPLNYGLPSITITGYTGISEVQPSDTVAQTLSATEALNWMHGKHNFRFGADYRRSDRDQLGGSNATGSFTFTGKFSGSAIGDFLLGQAQASSLDLSAGKSYLHQNIYDFYAQDDWRLRSNLTLNFGLRYENFAPLTEKNNYLAMIDTNAAADSTHSSAFAVLDEVQAAGSGTVRGNYSSSLIHGDHLALSPRFGLAARLPWRTVLRSGYGINFTQGQYASFAATMARQPMVADSSFVNEQSNSTSTAGAITLANGFSAASDTLGSFAMNPNYKLPYVQVWNLDLQKTLPGGWMLNLGYNGSRGSRLDETIAPRASSSQPLTDRLSQIFNYERNGAWSRFNGGTLRLNKRMSHGLSVGANYQYSHSIDNASSVGGTSSVVAQNWQNTNAEAGNSSFDQRHKVNGNYVIELPFGRDKSWVTTGPAALFLEGLSLSGNFTFATGTPLTPRYQSAESSVACGTSGSLRPDRDLSSSLTKGAQTRDRWFNTSAFSKPTATDSAYPCAIFGSAARNSIPGPGTVSNNLAMAKTMQLGSTRSMEIRATLNNAFNTVQYSSVDTSVDSTTFGEVTAISSMRQFQFTARLRF